MRLSNTKKRIWNLEIDREQTLVVSSNRGTKYKNWALSSNLVEGSIHRGPLNFNIVIKNDSIQMYAEWYIKVVYKLQMAFTSAYVFLAMFAHKKVGLMVWVCGSVGVGLYCGDVGFRIA